MKSLKELDIPVGTIKFGGGARSSLWRQIQADVYGQEVETIAADEGAAFGTAAGAWKTIDEACDVTIRISEKIVPDKEFVEILSRRYMADQSIYPVLRALFQQ